MTGPPPEYYVPVDSRPTPHDEGEAIAAVRQDDLRLSKRISACIQSHISQAEKKTASDAKDWNETVQIGSEFEHRGNEVLSVLEPHHKMWDSHLGEISEVEHEIDLLPDTNPHRSVPYRAGSACAI